MGVLSSSRPLKFVAACSLALLTAGGCGEDEVAAPAVIGPRGPVELHIVSFGGTGSLDTGAPPGGDVALGCDGLLHVRVTLKNWLLRPPNACAGARQCGWLVLRVDPEADAQALAQPAASALISAELEPLTPLEGEHVLRVELRYGDGSTVLSEGVVLSDEVTVRLIPAGACDPADAAPDADAEPTDADVTDAATDVPDEATDASDG